MKYARKAGKMPPDRQHSGQLTGIRFVGPADKLETAAGV